MVEESRSTTALNRSRRGMATGSAAMTVCPAALSNSSRKTAAPSVKRSSSACALIATPRAAATWVNPPSEICGFASQPKTSVWAKSAPLSLERRCTKPV
jgi:hypothetical protein